ncbi:hypothetical protein D3C85_772050 [compost metagenome]
MGLGAIEQLVAVGIGLCPPLAAGTVTVAQRQRVYGQALALTLDGEVALGPGPAVEAVHHGTGDEAVGVGMSRQQGERQRRHATGRQPGRGPARLAGGAQIQTRLADEELLAPDGGRRRPERLLEQDAGRGDGGMALEVGGDGGRRGLRNGQRPARVLLHLVLAFLGDGVGVVGRDQLEAIPEGDFGERYGVGRLAQVAADDLGLGGLDPGAHLHAADFQQYLPLACQLDAGGGGHGAGAIVLGGDAETRAVQAVRVLGLVSLLPGLALGPDLVPLGHRQDLGVTVVALGNGALGIGLAGLDQVAAPQRQRIHLQQRGGLVDHHLHGRHGLQGAVAAHGAAVRVLGRQGDRRDVVLGQVVDALDGAGADAGHRAGEVQATATVNRHGGDQGAELAALFVEHQLVVHVERMTFEATLELFETIVGQAHRAVAIDSREQAIEGEYGVILGTETTTDEGGVHHQLVDLASQRAFGQHLGGLVVEVVRGLGAYHQVHGARLGVEPAVEVFRLHHHGFDELGLVAAIQHQGVLGLQLLVHLLGLIHPLLTGVAIGSGRRPYRLVADDGREEEPVLQGTVLVAHAELALDPDDAPAGPGIAGGGDQRHHLTVTDHLVVELQDLLGPVEAGEVLEDQHGGRMTQIIRGGPFAHHHVDAVEGGQLDAVAHQIGGGDDPNRLGIGRQHGKIQPQIDAIRLVDPDQQRMLLLGRPAGQILGAIVPAVDLLTGHLGQAVAAELDLAALLPLAEQLGIEDLVFHTG